SDRYLFASLFASLSLFPSTSIRRFLRLFPPMIKTGIKIKGPLNKDQNNGDLKKTSRFMGFKSEWSLIYLKLSSDRTTCCLCFSLLSDDVEAVAAPPSTSIICSFEETV